MTRWGWVLVFCIAARASADAPRFAIRWQGACGDGDRVAREVARSLGFVVTSPERADLVADVRVNGDEVVLRLGEHARRVRAACEDVEGTVVMVLTLAAHAERASIEATETETETHESDGPDNLLPVPDPSAPNPETETHNSDGPDNLLPMPMPMPVPSRSAPNPETHESDGPDNLVPAGISTPETNERLAIAIAASAALGSLPRPFGAAAILHLRFAPRGLARIGTGFVTTRAGNALVGSRLDELPDQGSGRASLWWLEAGVCANAGPLRGCGSVHTGRLTAERHSPDAYVAVVPTLAFSLRGLIVEGGAAISLLNTQLRGERPSESMAGGTTRQRFRLQRVTGLLRIGLEKSF
ncbi:MAG: hypothetical protein AAGE52_35435 [Myxococcota bacterium]